MVEKRSPVWQQGVAYPTVSSCGSVNSVGGWYHTDTMVGMAMTLRTDEQLDKALGELAEAEGVSRQEIVRRAVLERYERAGHRADVAKSASLMMERWGDVLDRLGSA